MPEVTHEDTDEMSASERRKAERRATAPAEAVGFAPVDDAGEGDGD